MFFTKKPYESKRKDIYKKINHELKLLEQKYSKSSYLISTDNPLRFAKLNDIKSSHAFYKRLYYSEDITHLWKYINKQNTSHLIYVQSNTFHLPETEEIILEKYPENIFNMKYSHSSISIFEADTNFKREHPFQSTLTFTKNKEHWSYNPNNITNINRKRALKIDSNIIYEANFSLNTKPLPLSKESKIIITSDLKFQDIKACYFVLEIIRKDKKLFYSTIPLHKFALDTSSWCHPIKQFNYEWPKDKNVAIGFYFWNPGKATLWIDRITLKIL